MKIDRSYQDIQERNRTKLQALLTSKKALLKRAQTGTLMASAFKCSESVDLTEVKLITHTTDTSQFQLESSRLQLSLSDDTGYC